MKSLDDLKKLRKKAIKDLDIRNLNKDYRILVGMATCGISAGARPVLQALIEENSTGKYSCTISQTGCIGMCSQEPIVEVFDKNNVKTTYVHMTPEKAKEVMKMHIGKGIVVDKYKLN